MDETAPPKGVGTPSSHPQSTQSQESAQKTPPPPYKAPPPPYQAPQPPPQPSPPPAPPPPQPTETPPVSEPISEDFTVEPETPTSKLWLYILLGVFFVLLLIGGSVVFFKKQKNELKDLTNAQVEKIESIQTTYNQIITTIKEAPEEEPSATQHQLLGAKTSLEEAGLAGTSEEFDEEKVLGLEDSPEMIRLRKLGELYREGKQAAREMDSQNFNIGLKINSIPLNLFFAKNKTLIDRTETYAQEARDFLDYLDQENTISVKAITLGFEIGVAIEESILRGADDQSIQKLEEKRDDYSKLVADYRAIDTSTLTTDLREEHIREGAKAQEDIELINDIINSLKAKDIAALERSLQSLIIEAVVASETGLVETVSFWQKNPTARGIEEIKEDWEEFQEEIDKFPI